MKTYIKIIGKTEDKKLVIDGVFKMFDTLGTPLYIIFEVCEQENLMPSWIDFYKDAKEHGWKHKTIIDRLKENMVDVYTDEFINKVIKKLNEQ